MTDSSVKDMAIEEEATAKARQFLDVEDLTTDEKAIAAALVAANRTAAQCKAKLAALIGERYGMEEGTLKVYAKWGKISAEVVEAPTKKAKKDKVSLADYLAARQGNGLSA